LLEGVDMNGAKGVLVLISAAKGGLKLSESREAMNTIRAFASPDAHVIYGTAYDESLGDQIRVTVVATGLSNQQSRHQQPSLTVLRTGTDNQPFATQPHEVVNPQTLAGNAQNAGLGQRNYESTQIPSVWRTNRVNATAKVDAMASSGMDGYEIPAFLRKQAD
jgi:cell division protein FtsZ